MRLIEIKEKIRNTRIPRAIYNELVATEMDTRDDDSLPEKNMLVDQMLRAVNGGRLYRVPLTTETQSYLLFKSIPNLIDIAQDNQNRGLAGQLQRFQARLHAKLVGNE